jgi:hypothetical protein
VVVLNAGDSSFRSGDFATAAGLYQRVTNTPPSPTEGSASTAIDDLAHFRAMLSLLADGQEDDAHQQLDALQERDASSAFARVGAQFWDQYGMTSLVRAACAQTQPQIASQLGPTIATLQGVGVSVDAQTLCSVPQS